MQMTSFLSGLKPPPAIAVDVDYLYIYHHAGQRGDDDR